MKRWQRYFFSEIFKVFFFFLFGFFFLYSLMEYATHMDDFLKNEKLETGAVVLYYLSQFLKRLDFLLPMALLLSTIKVLTTLNIRNEWTVFQAAGLSTRTLLSPFLTVGFLCTGFLWANFEYFLPKAFQNINEFRTNNFHGSHLARRRELIHMIPLKDNSKLLYQSYLPEKDQLFDVLWIKNSSEIWRMKYLNSDPKSPMAYYVDHLIRSPEGMLEKKESYPSILLTDLHWHPRMACEGLIPFEQRKISDLMQRVADRQVPPYDTLKIKTALAFKLGIPLLSPLIVIGLAPVCLVFSRYRSLFLIYAIALFSLFAFYMFLDSLTVLSEHGLLSPRLAVFFPLLALASALGWRFWSKLCR